MGAPFQLGAKFGVGRLGGIEKTSLISLTSEERRTRPHMGRKMGSLIEGAHATSRWPHGRSLNHLVGAGKQPRRHDQAKGIGGFQIDDQFESRCLFDRDIGRVLAFENVGDYVGTT